MKMFAAAVVCAIFSANIAVADAQLDQMMNEGGGCLDGEYIYDVLNYGIEEGDYKQIGWFLTNRNNPVTVIMDNKSKKYGIAYGGDGCYNIGIVSNKTPLEPMHTMPSNW